MRDDQKRSGSSREGSRALAKVPARDGGSVADDRAQSKIPAVSQNARSRGFLATRNDSIGDYAKFAATAAVDIFDGEPLERFAAVTKMDELLLRREIVTLRREQMQHELARTPRP